MNSLELLFVKLPLVAQISALLPKSYFNELKHDKIRCMLKNPSIPIKKVLDLFSNLFVFFLNCSCVLFGLFLFSARRTYFLLFTFPSFFAYMYSPEVTKALNQSNRQFKKIFGVTMSTFFQILAILRIADVQRHRFGGRPSRIPLENKLLWTLQYWREYRTMEHLAYEYNTVVIHIHDEIVWIENAHIQDGTFCLQGKEVLQNPDTPYQTVSVDVTEHQVERSKKTRRLV